MSKNREVDICHMILKVEYELNELKKAVIDLATDTVYGNEESEDIFEAMVTIQNEVAELVEKVNEIITNSTAIF